MILQKLEIELASWGEHKGKYVGVAKFKDGAGDISLNLTPRMCEQIFEICADGILSVAKEAAANLTCKVIEHRKEIEA